MMWNVRCSVGVMLMLHRFFSLAGTAVKASGTDAQTVDKALLLQGFAIVGTAFLI